MDTYCKCCVPVILVSPALAECVEDLRGNASGLLIDFQHVCNELIVDNSRLVEDVNIRNNHIAELEENCVRLDQTLRKLNEVLRFFFSFLQ